MTPASDRRRNAAPWRRATVTSAALAAALLGTTFHAAAGGRLPTTPTLLVIVATLWALTAVALGPRPGPARLAGAVAFGQFAVHVALTASAGHGHATGHAHAANPVASSPAAAPVPAPGSLSEALGVGAIPSAAVGPDPVALAILRITEELTAAHAGMALAHVLAGLVVGAWLASALHGARMVAALRRVAAPVSALLLGPIVRTTMTLDAALRAAARVHAAPPRLRPQHPCRVVGRRGPPQRAAFLALPA